MTQTTIKPKTREELLSIIKETIKKKGTKCNLNFIDTSAITDMNQLFFNSKFNGDIRNGILLMQNICLLCLRVVNLMEI